MIEWQETLRTGAADLGLTLTPEQEGRFAQYLALLQQWNARVNLTAITEPVEVARKHFVDALTVERVWQPRAGDRMIDIGTGGGVPGIPLAIRYPDLPVVLNDSVRKKVDFLLVAVHELGLSHVTPVWARAETLGRDPRYREQFTVAIARAVAHLGALLEYALPLVAVGGTFIAMKGPGGVQEVADSALALEAFGHPAVTVETRDVPGVGTRTLIVVRKTRPTPAIFPRDPGAAKKKPLFTLTSVNDTP